MFYDGIKLLEGAQISNMTVETGTAFPTTGSAGELFFRTDESKLYVYDGTAWSQAGSGTGGSSYTAGTGISITGTTISSTVKSAGNAGQFLVQLGDGAGKFAGITAGSEGQVLTAHTIGAPTWEPAQVSGGTVTSVGVSGGQTGLTGGAPVTTDGTITLGGVLNIQHGGTGADTVSGIISNILPPQTNHGGAALVTDGLGNLTWEVQSSRIYTAGTGLTLTGTTFDSNVADNIGTVNRVQLSKGDGTLTNLAAGIAGTVLTSHGPGLAPTWENISGTVSNIDIINAPTVGLYIAGGSEYSPAVQYTKHISQTGSISLAGVLSIENGGTGVTTTLAAKANTLGFSNGNSGKFLKSVGTDAVWDLPIADQTGNSGKFLSTNGTSTVWTVPTGGGSVTSVDVSGGTSGLNFVGGPITQSGTLTLGGILSVANGGTGGLLPIANGGTGKTTAAEAINALVPAQTGNDGKILSTNGTSVSWATSSAGSVTSVDVSGGTSGLNFVGGPITQSGTLTLGGILSVANGGTGKTTAADALTALLPAQTGNDGKILVSDGVKASWSSIAGAVGAVTSVDASSSVSGLTFTGGPITSSGTLNLSGTLSIQSGGTGATTASQAITALLPAQAGNTGKVLTSNGTSASWTTTSAGSVTSVDATGGTTGLSFSGGPITASGTLQLGGTLSLSAGGTGATSALGARNALLPAQTSHAGQILITDGTNVSWGSASTLGNIAAGNTSEVQFNNAGALNSSSNFAYDNTANTLTLTTTGGIGLQVRSAASTQKVSVDLGRATASEASVGIAGTTSDYFTGAVSGDLVIKNTVGNILLGYGTAPSIKIDSSSNIVIGGSGYTVLDSNNTERLRVLSNGAWSVGSDGASTGVAGQVLTSNGASAAPTWQASTAPTAGSLTGSALAANVTSSSLTSVGTLLALSVSGQTSLSQYSELRGNVTATASTAFDCSLGNNFVVTMNASITSLTFTNVPAATRVYSMTMFLVQDTAGSRTITWPAYIKWSGGTAPTLTTTANKTDILSLVTYDGGSTWLGFVGGLNY